MFMRKVKIPNENQKRNYFPNTALHFLMWQGNKLVKKSFGMKLLFKI